VLSRQADGRRLHRGRLGHPVQYGSARLHTRRRWNCARSIGSLRTTAPWPGAIFELSMRAARTTCTRRSGSSPSSYRAGFERRCYAPVRLDGRRSQAPGAHRGRACFVPQRGHTALVPRVSEVTRSGARGAAASVHDPGH
jgi:hypothetical protein